MMNDTRDPLDCWLVNILSLLFDMLCAAFSVDGITMSSLSRSLVNMIFLVPNEHFGVCHRLCRISMPKPRFHGRFLLVNYQTTLPVQKVQKFLAMTE